MIYVKEHVTEEGIIIAMCDEMLIGKVLEEGNVVIDLKTYAEFYKGALMQPKEYMKGNGKILSANIIGDEAVATAVDNMIIENENIKKINGIPFAHAYHV
jgi:hypothetical protein